MSREQWKCSSAVTLRKGVVTKEYGKYIVTDLRFGNDCKILDARLHVNEMAVTNAQI